MPGVPVLENWVNQFNIMKYDMVITYGKFIYLLDRQVSARITRNPKTPAYGRPEFEIF